MRISRKSVVTLGIERRSSMYQTVIFAPALVVMIFTMTSFWLPTKYGERILLNGITALIIVLYLLYFSQKINAMSLETPLIGEFMKY